MSDPNANILSFTLPTDVLTGAGGGGLSFNYNFGPNADTIAQNAYKFLGDQTQGAMAFQNASIKGTQDFLTAPVAPILSAVAKESDAYYSQLLGAFGTGLSYQKEIGSQGISAQQQQTNASISASRKSQKGGSLLGAIFGGGCFITTAVCKYSGLPDDCDTLQTMRWWRDGWMQETAERKALVLAYYENAPGYVDAISRLSPQRQHAIWHALEYLIVCACERIKDGDNTLALAYYLSAVEFARVAAQGENS